jgi:hypothetical protein
VVSLLVPLTVLLLLLLLRVLPICVAVVELLHLRSRTLLVKMLLALQVVLPGPLVVVQPVVVPGRQVEVFEVVRADLVLLVSLQLQQGLQRRPKWCRPRPGCTRC